MSPIDVSETGRVHLFNKHAPACSMKHEPTSEMHWDFLYGRVRMSKSVYRVLMKTIFTAKSIDPLRPFPPHILNKSTTLLF